LGDVVINSNNSGEQKLTIGDTNDYGKIEFLRNGPNYIDAKATAGSLIIRTGASPTQTVEFNEDQSTVFAGNVWIGTDTAGVTSKLNIETAGTGFQLQQQFTNPQAHAAGVGHQIGFYGGSGDQNQAAIQVAWVGSSASNGAYMQFATRQVSDGALVPRMHITTSGNIGIGTTTPYDAGSGYTVLHMNNAASGGMIILGDGTNTRRTSLSSVDSETYLVAVGGMHFRTGSTPPSGTDRIAIDSSGHVTMSENLTLSDGELNVTNSSGQDNTINAVSGASGRHAWFRSANNANTVNLKMGASRTSNEGNIPSNMVIIHASGSANPDMYFMTNNTAQQAMIIKGSNQYVGIGSAPASRLWIEDTGGNPASGLTIANNASHNWSIYRSNTLGGSLVIEGEGTAPGAYIINTGSSHLLKLRNKTNTTGDRATMSFSVDNSTTNVRFKQGIMAERTGTYGVGKLHFLNDIVGDDGNAAVGDAKMTINESGNVGIGTTSTTSYHASADNLVIKGPADAGMTIHSGTTSSSALGGIYFADGTSSSEQYRGYIYYNHSSDAGFSIGTSGTTSLILSGGTTPTFQFGGSTVFRTATGNMTFGTGATYTMIQGTYVQFTASNMVYISSGKMRMYDNIPLEFGNDYDASIKYVSGTGVWEFGGKPISVTGGGINLTDTGTQYDAGNTHIGRKNDNGYISWPDNRNFYMRTLQTASPYTSHTNRFTFEPDGDFHASRYVYATFFNTSAADDVSSITKMYVETNNDGWIRHGTAAVVRTFLNVADGSNNYSHPSHPGDDMAVDTGALSGATVISDLDFNVTTDALGHVTDANAAISTRSLTPANIGAVSTGGSTITGQLQIVRDTDALFIKAPTNGAGADIAFSDVASTFSQIGRITFWHQDSKSYGSGASFVLNTTEATLTVLVDGKLMFKEGIYSKPGSGTGAGTRKDANWDTAYGWGNHGSAGYVTSSGNTIIGTDSDIDTSGATVIDTLTMTDGVITAHSTRSLTAANVGALPLSGGTMSGGISNASNIGFTSTGGINTKDDRIIEPNTLSSSKVAFGFTSFSNNNSSPWADFIHFNSYGDSSGGYANLVVFSKSSVAMRIYRQAFNSSSAFSSYKDVAMQLDSVTFSGITATGNIRTSTNTDYAQLRGRTGGLEVLSSRGSDSGILGNGSGGAFHYQLYGTSSGYYGFLDGAWSGWDIQKIVNGNFSVDEGGGLKRVLNEANFSSYVTAAVMLTAIKTVDGAGSGLDADTLDGVSSATFARHDAASTTFDGGTNTTINVVADDNGLAMVIAGDSTNGSQGTGAFEVTQDGTHGGGISYNGDGSPGFVSGESADYITFYNMSGGTRSEVFSYAYSGTTVYFNGQLNWSSGNSANANTAYGWGNHASAGYVTSNTWRGIDDTPVNGQTAESITSNWAYDHANNADGIHTQQNFTTTLKNKLDGIASSANNYSHPTSAGNKHVPTGGSADQVLTYSSSGTAVWADAGGGSGTINEGTTGRFAIYSPVGGGQSTTLAASAISIDSNNNVGIGTSYPNSVADYTTLTLAGTTSGALNIERGTTLKANLYAGSNFAAFNAVGNTDHLYLQTNSQTRLEIFPTGFVTPGVGKGNITGRYSYDQANAGQNTVHKIRGPNGGYLLDEMGNNMYARITIVTTGTSTSNAYCVYDYITNSDENSYTLTHLRGNSSAQSNKPYMGIDGKYPNWRINHSSGYLIAVTVEIHGGEGGTHRTGTSNYGA